MENFTLLHGEFLYFMAPPLLIFFYFILTHKEREAHFFSSEVLKRLQVGLEPLNKKRRNVLLTLISFLILFALAQPVIELERVKVETKSSDVMVALDISDSMLAEDIAPSRLKSAKQKVLDLLEVKADERFGVMAFAKEAYLVAPLSFDHKALTFLLKQLNTHSITEKGTDFKQLLFSANELLSKNENKYLLILSDGGDQESFSEEIDLAKEYGIKVFVLAVATQKGAPVKTEHGFIKYKGDILISKLNSSIKELALQTGGAYVEATTSSKDIKAMLAEIESHTKKKRLSEDEVRNYKQLFYYPLSLAVLLFLVTLSSRPKKALASVVIVVSIFQSTPSEAALLDFQLLDDAKEAYESGDYSKSAKLYGDYALRHHDMDALFNKADALYKAKEYKAAEESYKKVVPKSREAQFNKSYNLGNSFAMQGDLESLKKALNEYEEALKIRDDKNAKENLEIVKRAIKEQEEQKKENQKNSQDKKDKNQEQQKDQQNSQQNSQQNQEEQQKSKKDSERQKQKSDNEASQDEKNEKRDEKQKASESEDKQQPQEEKAQEKEKSESKEALQERNATQNLMHNPNEMSDKESQKQLMKILKNRPGHLYQMKAMGNKQYEEKMNEKPW